MKWMWSIAVVVVAVSSEAGAQSGKNMSKPAMGDTMTTTYTGCLEAVNHGGAFMLTHVADDRMAATDDGMTMKKDSAMEKNEPAMDDTNMHRMTPGAMVLTGSSNLRKHVGQKVSVTGSLSNGPADTMRNDLGTLTVSALKIVAKSCS